MKFYENWGNNDRLKNKIVYRIFESKIIRNNKE